MTEPSLVIATFKNEVRSIEARRELGGATTVQLWPDRRVDVEDATEYRDAITAALMWLGVDTPCTICGFDEGHDMGVHVDRALDKALAEPVADLLKSTCSAKVHLSQPPEVVQCAGTGDGGVNTHCGQDQYGAWWWWGGDLRMPQLGEAPSS